MHSKQNKHKYTDAHVKQKGMLTHLFKHTRINTHKHTVGFDRIAPT